MCKTLSVILRHEVLVADGRASVLAAVDRGQGQRLRGQLPIGDGVEQMADHVRCRIP
jgi:hypothetical protein